MKISVTVKTNARQACVEKIGEAEYRVAVKAAPVDGRANKAVIAVVAEHFAVAKSRVAIRSGLGAKKKIVEIAD